MIFDKLDENLFQRHAVQRIPWMFRWRGHARIHGKDVGGELSGCQALKVGKSSFTGVQMLRLTLRLFFLIVRKLFDLL